MALDNLISISFTEDDLEKMQQAITLLNEVLAGKVINLTPEERRQYGSIADRNKVLVDKVKQYMEQNPETQPRTLDKAEFDKDYATRNQLEIPLRSLHRIIEKMQDTKTLLDHDNFMAAISYYRYIKFLSSENEAETTSIYQDLRKHYQKSGKVVSKEIKEGSDEVPVSE